MRQITAITLATLLSMFATRMPTVTAEEPAGESECLWCRDKATGDWFGLRKSIADRGVEFDLSATQFYQGVASGGKEQEWEYGGKLDYFMDVDAGKLGLKQGFHVNMHAETRFGQSINPVDGLLAPSNIAMLFPTPNSDVTSITGLKLTQALNENFAIYAGKINTLDDYALRYAGGPGLGGFMNTSLVFNPILARTVPYSAAGVGAAFLREGGSSFTFTVFDPQERVVMGLEDLYARGVVLVPDLLLKVKPLGLPGTYMFGATYSNAEYVSVERSAWLDVPDVPGVYPVERGSWCTYANFYQSLWVDPCNEKRHWGLFGQFGISDGNPNPIRYTANGGIAGQGIIPSRNLDRFGVGYFYVGLSDNFKTLLEPRAPQQDEYGVELFYNYAITPWCFLSGDLQVARPSTVGLDTSILPGLRLQAIF
jgi:porin